MPHKFGANASNLVLMPKKTGGGGHYNFIFFLNYVLRKIGRTPGEPMEKPLTFSIYIYIYIYMRISFSPTKEDFELKLTFALF
jgi:hypothetical protein